MVIDFSDRLRELRLEKGYPKGMFEDTVEGDMHEVWIKLPELESR